MAKTAVRAKTDRKPQTTPRKIFSKNILASEFAYRRRLRIRRSDDATVGLAIGTRITVRTCARILTVDRIASAAVDARR